MIRAISMMATVMRLGGTAWLIVLVYQGSRGALAGLLVLLTVGSELQAILWRKANRHLSDVTASKLTSRHVWRDLH